MKIYKLRHKTTGQFWGGGPGYRRWVGPMYGKTWTSLNYALQSVEYHNLDPAACEVIEYDCNEVGRYPADSFTKEGN